MANAEQQLMFYDDYLSAIRRTIEDGHGYKKTAAAIWPTMKMDSAYARLKGATQDGGTNKLDLSEVVAVCRFNGRFDPIYFMCDELMLSRPLPMRARDVAKTTAAQIEAAIGDLSRLMTRAEALRSAAPDAFTD